MLNGTPLSGQNIRLSWGRSPSNRQVTFLHCSYFQDLSVESALNLTIRQDPSIGAVQPQPDPSQYGGYYGYGHGYETYGYAPPAQDPNMYYGYSGYGNYQQPQQQQQQVQYSQNLFI